MVVKVVSQEKVRGVLVGVVVEEVVAVGVYNEWLMTSLNAQRTADS